MFISTSFLVAGLLMAETQDTLQMVTVVADRGVVVSRADTVQVKEHQTITELLQQTPGAYVGDNGGYAGLKTISIRGMGSAHTAIYVDGVRVGNVQSGQSDIGVLGLENFSKAVVDYAQNSLSFITGRPTFIEGRNVGGSVAFSAGSFGTYLPSALLDWKISEKLTLSANVAAVFSKGDFQYGNGQKRENNDIKQGRGGLDLFGLMDGGDYHVKAWVNGSERGVAGSVTYPSTDRQKDLNVHAQSLVRKQFGSLYHLDASGKIAYDDLYYTSSWGDNRYAQTEAQLNTSHQFKINTWLTLSAAADFYWDGLKSSAYNQQRIGTTQALSASFRVRKFKADLAVQYDGVFDLGQKNRNYLSPSLDLRYRAFSGIVGTSCFDLTAFVRRAYRVPTFNELYFAGYGNPELRPEDAWLSDIGVEWTGKYGPWKVKAKLDGYYNFLQDKIISAPTQADPNIWLPYNIGKVRSTGADAFAGADYESNGWLVALSVRYGFQDAVDKTPDSNTYGEQIAYVSRHSFSANAMAGIRGWSAELSWNLRAGRRDSYGTMPDWNTLDLFLAKSFNLGKGGIPSLKLAFKNITDTGYELVSGYPMPQFSVTGGITYKF